jgi:hypothetical protein
LHQLIGELRLSRKKGHILSMGAERCGARRHLNRIPLPYSGVEGEADRAGSRKTCPSRGVAKSRRCGARRESLNGARLRAKAAGD